ncbi:tropomyosin-like isoform X2 [Leucoraja erinacea]|uniref:tropomyosin-like isoform X2 n=1 Tax=Leucoraja erinaceus TaxID=7782 RepID=UPI002453F028|nr:tropomyosin-like isoform X2 [Leucoraja erinacea]
MWRCICGNEKPRASEGALCCQSSKGRYLVADLTEQVAQYEQLVVQLQKDIQDKDTQLHVRDEQLKVLEELKEKLREQNEAQLETTQHEEVLERKLNEKNRELAELVEDCRKLEDLNENLDNQLLDEHYASLITVRDLKEGHKADLANLKEQVRLLSQEAESSEDSSLAIETLFQSKIEQIQEELDNVQKLLLEHRDVEIDNEEEDDQLHLNVNWPHYVKRQNEKLQTIVEEDEDESQFSQTSESESESESEEELVKWRETVSKSTLSHDNNESIPMYLRVNQVEEKREELPELEEEVRDLQRPGQVQGWTKQTTAGQNLMENEELEATQQERTEEDPSSSKTELPDLRPAPRKYSISLASFEECEEDLEIDPSEEVVVVRKAKRRVNFFKRLFTARK